LQNLIFFNTNINRYQRKFFVELFDTCLRTLQWQRPLYRFTCNLR